MTYRALELLNLPPDEPLFLLDIGCGSGLSGEILDEEGYMWAGVDIAPSMLGMLADSDGLEANIIYLFVEVALEREVEGDLFLQDIGQGFGFRPGSFDGAIRLVLMLSSMAITQGNHSTQYISSPMASQCRDIPPNIVTSTPTHPLL
jgi:18S rRNA (guanine1575-N7)-methyltransferase